MLPLVGMHLSLFVVDMIADDPTTYELRSFRMTNYYLIVVTGKVYIICISGKQEVIKFNGSLIDVLFPAVKAKCHAHDK